MSASHSSVGQPIDLSMIREARERLRSHAVVTPLLEDHLLSRRVAGRVLLKAEGLQRHGSFKFRGAYNRLAQLDQTARAKGVVAWSSGNHAQGVAAAARMLDMQATIVMPDDAPQVKIANTRDLGAKIVTYDRRTQDREEIARAICADQGGATLVPSYDDPDVIAGQGTIGIEIFEQAASRNLGIDQVLVCCGGGGLVAGIATALHELAPGARVFSVEPAEFDDTARSLAAGTRLANSGSASSICDALLAPQPGSLTFPINRRLLAGGISVTDDEVRDAMRHAFANLGLVVEPGGAVALAAALTAKVGMAGLTTVVILSGANVDPATYASIINGHLA